MNIITGRGGVRGYEFDSQAIPDPLDTPEPEREINEISSVSLTPSDEISLKAGSS